MSIRYMTGESMLEEDRRNCRICDNYRGYVCAEHREPSYAELQGEVLRLQHIISVLKCYVLNAAEYAQELEGNIRVRDGRVEVWCLGDWVDVKQAQEKAEGDNGDE